MYIHSVGSQHPDSRLAYSDSQLLINNSMPDIMFKKVHLVTNGGCVILKSSTSEESEPEGLGIS